MILLHKSQTLCECDPNTSFRDWELSRNPLFPQMHLYECVHLQCEEYSKSRRAKKHLGLGERSSTYFFGTIAIGNGVSFAPKTTREPTILITA